MKSIINLYQKNALLYLAGMYPKLDLVILEYIQNAIDINAQKIWVVVNLKKGFVSIKDDGDGTSVPQFEKALQSVCKSVKEKGKLGQYGIGLVSWIGKCKTMTFTSTPKSNPSSYKKWIFDQKSIETGEVSYSEESKLFFSRNEFKEVTGRDTVSWRTQVLMESISRDHQLTKIAGDEFESAILEKYSEAMRKKHVSVYLTVISTSGERVSKEIQALEFKGKKLPVYIEQGTSAGKTVFNLYIANKGARGRQGKVGIGIEGDDFRIGFSTFAKSADLLNADTAHMLASGIFEGNITSQKCILHPGRKGFVENDALIEFCEHVESWAEKIGVSYAAEVSEGRKDERYQYLGVQSMKLLEGMLSNPKFRKFLDLIKSAKYGTVGLHHFEKPETEVGSQNDKSLSITSIVETDREIKRERKNEKPFENTTPKTDHSQHTPLTVIGPVGRKRIRVKGHSTGLQFSYEEMGGVSDLWKFDSSSGILSFNIRHPFWEIAEKNDLLLMRFQETIAIKVLNLEVYPEEWKEVVKTFIMDELEGSLFHLESMLPKKGPKKIFKDQDKKK